MSFFTFLPDILQGLIEQFVSRFLAWESGSIFDDRWGNRTINQSLTTTSADINKKLFSVTATNNRLGVPSGQTGAMTYDAVGNLIFDSYTNPGKIDAMTYDAENHMTSAANGGHQYRYNADGKRVKRTITGTDGGTFWMVYGIGGELVAEITLPAAFRHRRHRIRNTATATGKCWWSGTTRKQTPT